MKVLFSSRLPDPRSDLDPHFGRAPYFLVYDLCSNLWDTFPNDARDAADGAGIRAASHAARLGVHYVVTGRCGPKAQETLRRSGIRLLDGFSGPVMPILDQVRRIAMEAGA